MYELWARKRAVNDIGEPFKFIMSFGNEDYKYSAIDSLDKNIYEEAIIVEKERCILYVKLEKPFIKKKER